MMKPITISTGRVSRPKLKRFESKLRARESSSFDDDTWWRFGRNQNIDKQEDRKLIVAQTVKSLSVCPDDKGKFYLNNVRVNGILPKKPSDFWYLLGILNSSPCNWVFQRIAKPKEGGYFEANKQFIAPLPIPTVPAEETKKVAELAQKLTTLHTERRNILSDLERRFEACDVDEKPVEWLWPAGVRSLDKWKAKAPAEHRSRQRTAWAKEQQAKEVEIALDILKDALRPGARLEVELVKKRELRVVDEGATVLEGVFVDSDEAAQVLVDWRNYLRLNTVPETPDAAALASALRRVRKTDNPAIAKQITELDEELCQIEKDISTAEAALDKLANQYYGLTDEEQRIMHK